jgi:hypothetical protein
LLHTPTVDDFESLVIVDDQRGGLAFEDFGGAHRRPLLRRNVARYDRVLPFPTKSRRPGVIDPNRLAIRRNRWQVQGLRHFPATFSDGSPRSSWSGKGNLPSRRDNSSKAGLDKFDNNTT